MNRATLSVTNLQDTFDEVIQSYRTVVLNSNNSLRATIVVAHLPSGSGGDYQSQQAFIDDSERYIPIINSDNTCGIRAVIVAIAYEKTKAKHLHPIERKQNQTIFNKLTRPNSSLLQKEVLKVKNACYIADKPCGIKEFQLMEIFFKYYQINIIKNDGVLDKEPLYRGPPNKKQIYINYTESHYNVIKYIKKFFKCKYFCEICKVKYNNIRDHYCKAKCNFCNREKCKILEMITCDSCNTECNSPNCLKFHSLYMCRVENNCKNCNTFKKKIHVCSDKQEKYCRNCKLVVKIDHRCFILTEDEKVKHDKKDDGYSGLIWFDYEAYQFEDKHIANLIVADKLCKNCLNNLSCTSKCGLHTFYNNTSFCEWLFSKAHQNYTAIAHNAQGYDGIFLMNHIVKTMTSENSMPSIILRGTKILTLTYKSIRLIDSYSFIPMSLEKFPSTFGLKEIKKGFFPHLFNTIENQNYAGSIPDAKFFAPDFFSENKRKEFYSWYNKERNYFYVFQHELLEYCKSDVQLLKEGTLAYRKIILDITKGIDPFEKCITMAGVCHLIYRSLIMKPKTIGIIPLLGFNPEQNSSAKAFKWLQFISISENKHIKHSKNGGEFQVGKYRVDGYHEESKTIYEFNGCYWHGCPRCFSANGFNNQKYKTYGMIYRDHCERIKKIQSYLPDHKIIQLWECEFSRLQEMNPNFEIFVRNNFKSLESLNPRDSLFGGRTNSIKLYHKCEPNEKIMYVDYKSLYPSVQKYCEFPIGQPTIITENFQSIENYFGLVKCSIIPPRKLHIPVLPVKVDGKLYFPLCLTCAKLKLNECFHNDNERELTGTWVTLEVQTAIKHGYRISQIYEVWHYEERSAYDSVNKKSGLFSDYVDMFLKYKEEASGFPDGIITEQEKDNYIEKFFEQEGITLDKDKIEYNAGIRSVMKLLLNSFWGRLGMQTNVSKVKYINNPDQWYKLIGTEQCVINDIDLSVDGVLIAYYSEKKQSFDGGNSINQINVVLASFVTCHGRLKLFNEMFKLGEQVIYHDTDSIIYSVKPGQYSPKLGDNLGELTNEISLSEGGHIIEIVAPGPKNYIYKKKNGKCKSVIKGFSLNYKSEETINLDSVKNILFNDRTKTLNIDQLKFTRKNWNISTSVISKMYQFVYDKRYIVEEFKTRPYGY